MANIAKQFTKFIFPFYFDPEGIEPKSANFFNKKGTRFSVFEQFTQPSESLREGLDCLLAKDGGTAKIAECYRLNINCRKLFSLPPRKTEWLDFGHRQASETTDKVAITEIALYFFESKVGFIEIECEYESTEVEKYIELNYFISELKGEKNEFIFHEKVWNEETKQSIVEDRRFTMRDLLNQVITEVSKREGAVRLFNENGKPMIYSYLLLNEKPQDIDILLQYVGRNYKRSYKFEEPCGDLKKLRSFDNSYWVSSLNGTTNVSFLTADSITDGFFEENFYSKTKGVYYFLFLNIIHQRYATTYMLGQIGRLDRLGNDYYTMDEQLKAARRCEAEAINLHFRAFFKNPSLVEHVNTYYNMLYGAFQVNDLYEGFSADIQSLQNICSKYVERIKEREEKFKKRKSAKTEIFVSIFGAIVAEITLFNNSWSVVEKVLGRSISFLSPGILILLATLISPLITIFINVKKKTEEIKQLTAEIESEREQKLVEDDKTRKKNGKLLAKFKKKIGKDRKKN